MSLAASLRRLRPQQASLSSKVLWFTVTVIISIEMLIMLFALGKLREDWMINRLNRAQLAVYALSASNAPEAAENVLQFAGLDKVTLLSPRHHSQSWQISNFTDPPDLRIEPFHESLLHSVILASKSVAGFSSGDATIIAPTSLLPGATLEVSLSTAPLAENLNNFARNALDFAVVVALVTGLLVYAVLNKLLVQPMEILTSSIIRFREAPEEADSAALDWLAGRPKDDISTAARELKSMQSELRGTLWRNARLAAVGTAVAKISHDLRNILSSVLLVADRLQTVDEPVVKRASAMLIPAVERASSLVSSTVDFAREGPPPVNRSAVRLRALIDEVIEALQPESSSWSVENLVPEPLELPLDRMQLHRVFNNLFRNAAEAGATLISVSTEDMNGHVRLRVSDNGPGMPPKAQANLFRPFSGSVRNGGTGLGLTIARDLIRAHGGDLVLERTGAKGTVFCMDITPTDLPLS